MTAFALQIVAMVMMVLHHTCSTLGGGFATIVDGETLFGSVVRLGFPIYAFLLAEAYRHVRKNPQKLDRCLGNYIILAVVSEFCYDLRNCEKLSVKSFISSQSVIITLLLGFLGLMAIDRWKDTNKVLVFFTVILTALTSEFLNSNYAVAGVLLIYAFYWYLTRFEGKSYGWRFATLLVILFFYLAIYHAAVNDFAKLKLYFKRLEPYRTWQLCHIPVAAMLAAYNGERGYTSKKYKLFYRCFYPAHLLILGLIRHLR